MEKQSNRYIKRLLIPCYIQFVLCILFWIGAGADLFTFNGNLVYMLMSVITVANIIILIFAIMLDRFYLKDIRQYFSNLENLNSKLRSQRHEYLNEMQVVYGLLELEEYKDAYEYLKPVYTDIAKVGKAMKTSRPAVNALLQAKYELADRKGVDLFIDVSSDLSHLNMEQWDVCRVLSNLIDNALTAVSHNGECKKKEVHVNLLENSESNILLVYNNGPEIPRDKLETIFKKGYTSKKEEGHGMGLGIVKDIVNDHSGNINVKSDSSETQFEIRIPKSV